MDPDSLESLFIIYMKIELNDEIKVYKYLESLPKNRLIEIINILTDKKCNNKKINKKDLESVISLMIEKKNNNFTNDLMKIIEKNYEMRKINKKMIGGYLQNFGCKLEEWGVPKCI